MRPFSVVLLAAGGSERPGRHKLLLHYLGRSLVEHAARTALASGAAEVIVVVGSKADAIGKRLRGLPVRIVPNREWTEGLSSSIRCGVAALDPLAECVVVALADQPQITPFHLRELAGRTASVETPLAASSYDGIVGAPCAFDRSEFHRLLALRGSGGARSLIRDRKASVAIIAFDGANVEVEQPKNIWVPVTARPAFRRTAPPRDPYIARGPPTTCSASS